MAYILMTITICILVIMILYLTSTLNKYKYKYLDALSDLELQNQVIIDLRKKINSQGEEYIWS